MTSPAECTRIINLRAVICRGHQSRRSNYLEKQFNSKVEQLFFLLFPIKLTLPKRVTSSPIVMMSRLSRSIHSLKFLNISVPSTHLVSLVPSFQTTKINLVKSKHFHTKAPKMAAVVDTIKSTIAENFGGARSVLPFPDFGTYY